MGLIDFVKGAGRKLKGDDGGSDLTDPAAIAGRIQGDIEKLGFSAEGLEVSVDGDRVTLRGHAATQADREKIVLVAGNTFGVASVDDQMTSPAPTSAPAPAADAPAEAAPQAPAAEPTYYTVVSGDSLSKIAKEFYGDPMKYPVLFEANRPMLEDPDLIYPGQKLRIPPAE